MLERSRRVILLIDFDNLQICASRDTPGRDLQLDPVVSLAQRFGTVIMARAYAEWNLSTERLAVYKAGIEPAFAPVLRTESDRSGKSLADTVMVAEGMDMLWTLSPDVMVLATSDKDLIPLVRVARQRGTRVVVLGSDFTAIPLRDMADEHVTYKQLITDAAGRYVDGPSMRSSAPSEPVRRGRSAPEREPREPRRVPPATSVTPAAAPPSAAPLVPAATPAIAAGPTEAVAPVSAGLDLDGPLGGRRRRRRGSRRRSDRVGGSDEEATEGASDQALPADATTPVASGAAPSVADATGVAEPSLPGLSAASAPSLEAVGDVPELAHGEVFQARSGTTDDDELPTPFGDHPEQAPPLLGAAPAEASLVAEPDASATDLTPAAPDAGGDAVPDAPPVKRPRARRVASASRGRSRPVVE